MAIGHLGVGLGAALCTWLAVTLTARAALILAARRRWPRIGRAAAHVLVWTWPGRDRRLLALWLAPYGANARRAGQLAEAVLARMAAPIVSQLNLIVNAFIFAGRYRDALAVVGRWDRATLGRVRLDPDWPLLQINLAEAEYNLGQWAAAATRLAAIADEIPVGSALTRAGFAMQAAWVAAHTPDVDALAHCAALDPAGLGDDYAAEYHFVYAAAHLKGSAWADARAHADEGLRRARRRSSERNALNLRAQIALAGGDTTAALRDFARAAAHPYRGQGGPELVTYGAALAAHGDADGARRAWAWASERDPESPAAARATALRAALPDRPA